MPNDLPMRGLEQRDIPLWISWREPGLIEKPQGRDHDLPRHRKLIGIISDPKIETVDDAAVVAFVDEHVPDHMPKPVDLNQPVANSASRIRNPQLGRKANAPLDPKTERFESFLYPTATPMCGSLLVAKATLGGRIRGLRCSQRNQPRTMSITGPRSTSDRPARLTQWRRKDPSFQQDKIEVAHSILPRHPGWARPSSMPPQFRRGA